MCGVCGVLTTPGRTRTAEVLGAVDAMTAALSHRGPDDGGIVRDEAAGIAIGHRRLAVLDPSAAGRQPMSSPSGRWIVSYNGEVYNHLELRDRLGDVRFRGQSDTESLAAAIEAWGLRRTVEAANGMFALAAWDRDERRLGLARDRLGIKPLYYGRRADTWLFASDLRALRRHPVLGDHLDLDAVREYLRCGFVPGPRSIERDVWKLPPGHLVWIDRHGATPPERYWSAPADEGHDRRSPEELVDELDALLIDSVRLRLLSDVPLGAFLSGGIDSSTVVSLMAEAASGRVRTFTIGFDDREHDESRAAAEVARRLGTDHAELQLTDEEALRLVPELPDVFDEPFADSSQLPTLLVSRLARQSVTVVLSGDGADELFGGYQRYLIHGQSWQRLGAIPRPVRRIGGIVASGVAALGAGGRRPPVHPFLPAGGKGTLEERARRYAALGALQGPHDLYDYLSSQWQRADRLVLGPSSPATPRGDRPATAEFVDLMMDRDLRSYLPDDILTKVDRASMHVSLEARVPMLDHRVVEFARRLPTDLKFDAHGGKWILRQVLLRHLPSEFVDRPKHGFTVPVDSWLRGPLRGWAEDLLSERRLEDDGLLDPRPIRNAWQRHLEGAQDHGAGLWYTLMLQAWLDSRWARQRSVVG